MPTPISRTLQELLVRQAVHGGSRGPHRRRHRSPRPKSTVTSLRLGACGDGPERPQSYDVAASVGLAAPPHPHRMSPRPVADKRIATDLSSMLLINPTGNM